MFRKLLLLSAFAFTLSTSAAIAGDTKAAGKGKPKTQLDKDKLFDKLDSNSDGKITKEEFKTTFGKLQDAINEKGGEKVKKLTEKMDAEKTFEKIDADKDGKITKEEFAKFEPAANAKKKTKKKTK
jgi:EF-hand domain pair